MKDFLMKIKGYCDSLASCGEVISEREHVTAILNGLSSEYESVLTIITASPVPYSVQGVTTYLMLKLVNNSLCLMLPVLRTLSPTSLLFLKATVLLHQLIDPLQVLVVVGVVALQALIFSVNYAGRLVTLLIDAIIDLIPHIRV